MQKEKMEKVLKLNNSLIVMMKIILNLKFSKKL